MGGLGKEWTSSEGKVINTDPQWVKSIGSRGEVEHIDWKHVYNKIRQISGYSFPGNVCKITMISQCQQVHVLQMVKHQPLSFHCILCIFYGPDKI